MRDDRLPGPVPRDRRTGPVPRDRRTGGHRSWRSPDLGRGLRLVGLLAGRTRRRLELVLSPPARVVSLPVKMQSVVRALTADTLSFDENTLSAIVRVGPQGRRADARPTEESIGSGNCRIRIR